MSEQTAHAETPAPTANAPHPKINATQIVWQLLTYTLWGWALTALSILLGATFNYYIVDRTSDYEFSLYALAALICLLPLAYVADRLYTKEEPEQKHGFSAVVMVLSAVIVFLMTLGGFITAVVTGLPILVNPGDTTEKISIILTALVVSGLGGILFVRIMNPPRLQRFTRRFPLVVVAIVGLSLAVASAGPFVAEISARNDRLLEEQLPRLNDAIQDYARDTNHLPDNLESLLLTEDNYEDAKILIDKGLVEYRKLGDSTPETTTLDLNKALSQTSLTRNNSSTLRYELCATYKRRKGDPNRPHYTAEGTSSYVSTYEHKAGRQCYTPRAYVY